MSKGKQKSAVELIESFKNYFRNRLSPTDRAYCDQIISLGVDDRERFELLSAYIEMETNLKGLDYVAIGELSNSMGNYIAVLCGLLLSYSPLNKVSAHIPEKYYISAPKGLRVALTAIPHNNIIILAEKYSDNAWYGSKQDKSGNLLTIKVFKEEKGWHLIYDGGFIDAQYPRYSVSCHGSGGCRAYMKADLNFYSRQCDTPPVNVTECLMSPNRAKICPLDIEFSKAYGLGLCGILALVVMCYDRWQNRPVSTGTKKWESYSGMGVSAIVTATPQWEHISEGFREVRLHDYPEYVQQTRASGFHVENRSSPCEHERRGHMRTLKDGRMVYVRPSVINKGGEKVVYKVSGEHE